MISNLEQLNNQILSKEPLSIVRIGNVEVTSLLQQKGIYKQMFTNAGFYGNEEIYKKWKNLYVQALMKSDCLLDVYTCRSFHITGDLLIKLNLWKPTLPYVEDPKYWIELIKKIKEPIGIVSFFKADITRQIGKLNKIWDTTGLMKDFVIVKAYQTISGNEPHEHWFKTFIELQKKIDKHPHIKVWFVSCGCYGLPLCDYLKNKGCRAIYVGGLLQLFFGLKGSRWDSRKDVTQYYNRHWVYPKERPKNAENVESGCYWGAEEKKKKNNSEPSRRKSL